MNFKKSVFTKKLEILNDAQVIFVSDFFVSEFPSGGAELTTDALIENSPYKVQKIKSNDLTIDLLKKGHDKYWIFGNATGMDTSLIPTIVANMRYSVVEYDFKFCRARSPEKHELTTNQKCDCHEQMIGKTISAFFHGAKSIFWMSEGQSEVYFKRFPFLKNNNNYVISSIFSKPTLAKLKALREEIKVEEKKGWVVLGSDSWIKGSDNAIKYCEEKSLSYTVAKGLPYDEVLSLLASSEGFVYLPKGSDTCPRMVIEAKLLNCKIVMNDFVMHNNEEWFADDNIENIESYLYGTPELFWNIVRSNIEYVPTLSGYTTVYNAESQKYPYEKVIKNMLEFCDEVCVVDGGSDDGTWEKLVNIVCKMNGKQLNNEERQSTIELFKQGATNNEKTLRIKQIKRDWNSEGFALFDGQQKAEARSMCTKDFCWQMDSDEILPRQYYEKVTEILSSSPANIGVVALPVIEYWGGYDKVRIDVQPWKWRLSKNDPDFTHGVPKDMIEISNGKEIVKQGTDGCDMIRKSTRERLGFMTFHTKETEEIRQRAVNGDKEALKLYQKWLNGAADQLPTVHHYSWIDIERKIKLYKNFWSKHWCSLWNKDQSDIAENNMFFDIPWSNVTDEMIVQRAKELSTGTGGWIFHQKWTGQNIPSISISNVQKI